MPVSYTIHVSISPYIFPSFSSKPSLLFKYYSDVFVDAIFSFSFWENSSSFDKNK